jgi:hypothetical protein
MGDVLILFAAALLTLGGAVTAALTVRSGRRRRALAGRDRPRRLQQELRDLDDYIRRVNQATADEQIDRLEQERKNP